jgi:endonuclease III
VKNATACAKQLTAILKKLPDGGADELPEQDDPIAVLVQSFLMWEASTAKARVAYDRLRERVVDFNDLRMCMPHELEEYLGSRYPLAGERSQRLRATLRNIFMREHAVTLESLHSMGKRDIKKYVESLEGMTPYVAARLMLLCFDTHAIPVDEQLRSQLVAAGAADESADVGELAAWLGRQVKANQGQAVAAGLQAWIDEVGGKAKTTARGGRKKTTKKTAKKTTKKKTSKKTTSKKSGSRRAASSTR